MCNVGSAPVPKRPTREDIVGEDPWSNPIINPAFAQDPTGIMRQSDVAAIDAINAAFGTEAIKPASEMLGGMLNPESTNVDVAQARRSTPGEARMSPVDYEAAQAAKAAAAEEEKKRIAAWQGEGRSRQGRASTLLTGPRGLSSDGTTARRTLLAM